MWVETVRRGSFTSQPFDESPEIKLFAFRSAQSSKNIIETEKVDLLGRIVIAAVAIKLPSVSGEIGGTGRIEYFPGQELQFLQRKNRFPDPAPPTMISGSRAVRSWRCVSSKLIALSSQ